MKHFSEISASAERVVDAAEGLVQRFGYNGFSYDDIATIVGIKKPSIHHHVPTKAELVAVVAQRYAYRFRAELLGIEGQHAKVRDRLLAYANLFEQTFANDRHLCVCGMLGAEAEALPPNVASEIQRFFAANVDWLTEVLADGQRDQQIRQDIDAATFAEAFFCALEGAMVVGRGMQSPRGPALLGRAMITTVLA